MGLNGYVSLSAVDLLGLTEKRKVARVDLATTGYSGVLYVCDLTTAQQQKLMAGPKDRKTRLNYKESTLDVNWGDLFSDAGAKIFDACVVTDKDGGAQLEAAFQSGATDGAMPDYIVFPADQLTLMSEQMQQELGSRRLVLEKLDLLPNAITSAVVGTMRRISGMDEAADRVLEKKESY